MSEEDVEVIVSTDEDYQIPLDSLSIDTVQLLCSEMNYPSEKMFAFWKGKTRQHCSANVKGFLNALGYGEKEKSIIQECSPMLSVLNLWSTDLKNTRSYTVGTLVELLHELERYDVLYALTDRIKADTSAWNEKQQRMQEKEQLEEEIDRLRVGLFPPMTVRSLSVPDYDAVFSYDTSSPYATGFMMEIFDQLSVPPYNLRLCKGTEDLLVPGDLKTESFIKFLDTRWRRVIVLLTKNYLNSSSLKEQLHASRINGIKEHQRKVIPVEVEPGIKIPDSLLGIVSVRYFNAKDRQQHIESIFRAIKHDS